MAEVGQAWHKELSERVSWIIKEEEMDLSEYEE
jgi:hypothetical protein